MGFSTPPGHKNPTYDANTNGLVDRAEGVNVPDYTEDANSPFTATQQASLTVQLATPSDNLLVLADPAVTGYDAIQVNGVTGFVYDHVFRDGTLSTKESTIPIPAGPKRTRLRLQATDSELGVFMETATAGPGDPVGGNTTNVTAPITQFRLSDRNGTPRNARVRVYRIDI